MWLFLVIVGILSFVIGQVGYRKGWFRGANPPLIRKSLMGLGTVMTIIGILLTSFLVVPTQHTAHLIKKYGKELPTNRVIAINGERGRQSQLLQEGLNISLFVRVLYDIEFVPYEKINEGEVGLLSAVDGTPMGKDLFIAPDWVQPVWVEDTISSIDSNLVKKNELILLEVLTNGKYLVKRLYDREDKRDSIERAMLDPVNFIKNGGNQGPQLNVLKPGEYKINKYQWDVKIVPVTRVPDGHVGVIISRVGKVPIDIQIGADGNELATPVVDKGYMGVWKETLKPGMYYLNRHPDLDKGAYEIKLVDTRVQTWTYKGGYNWYTIDLEIGEDGKITQTKSELKEKPIDPSSADGSIRVISNDGWNVFVDGRILVQVQPQDAPYIIASVGGLKELEDRITTPLMRSVLRNMGESREATSFVWERSTIEKEAQSKLIEGSRGTKLTIKEFKMNDVYIKPELLVPDKREQLAKKMETTYKQEQLAYTEKIKTEKAREEASQQGVLVSAKIGKQAAAEFKEAEYLRGQGTKLRMQEEAIGQKALRDVLGEQNTFKLEMASKIKDFPAEAWQVPLFNSGGNSGNDAYTALTIRNMMGAMNEMGIDPVVLENNVNRYNKNHKKTKVNPTPVEPINEPINEPTN